MKPKKSLDECKDVLSIEDVQDVLGIGRNTVYRLLRDGTIASLKIGNKYLIPKVSIVEMLGKK